MPVDKLEKLQLEISTQPPPTSVWVAEAVVVVKTEFDAKLTENGYQGLKYQLAQLGYVWSDLITHFDYTVVNTAWDGGATNMWDGYASGWYIQPISVFDNGSIPPRTWVPDSWLDTVLGATAQNITIPAHYETTTPPPVITFSQNLGWNASVVSAQSVKGTVYFTFRIDDTNTGAAVGLNISGSAANSQHYTDMSHAIKTAGNQFQIVELGVTKTSAASFISADVFKIVFTALAVTYYKNATLIYTSLTALADLFIKLDVSLYEAGDKIYDANFMQTFLGVYVDLTALQTAYPTATLDDYATVTGVGVYVWSGAAWVLSGLETVTGTVYTTLVVEIDLVISNPLAVELDLVIGNPLAVELDLVIGILQTLAVELDLVIAVTQQLAVELDLVIDVPFYNTLAVELDLVIAVLGDIEGLVFENETPQTPKFSQWIP